MWWYLLSSASALCYCTLLLHTSCCCCHCYSTTPHNTTTHTVLRFSCVNSISIFYRCLHPALALVSTPVTVFCPFSVGFLHRFFKSKSPIYESVKSCCINAINMHIHACKHTQISAPIASLNLLEQEHVHLGTFTHENYHYA
jgi:hypothetical protein